MLLCEFPGICKCDSPSNICPTVAVSYTLDASSVSSFYRCRETFCPGKIFGKVIIISWYNLHQFYIFTPDQFAPFPCKTWLCNCMIKIHCRNLLSCMWFRTIWTNKLNKKLELASSLKHWNTNTLCLMHLILSIRMECDNFELSSQEVQ